jgi:hypothetical protein
MSLHPHSAAFLLGAVGINTPFRENLVTVIIVAVIESVGTFHIPDMLMVLSIGTARDGRL